MMIQDDGDSYVISLELSGCLIYFKHRLLTAEEFNSFKLHRLEKIYSQLNPSLFSVADKFMSLMMNKGTV
jgi:hypothetical protein